MLLDHAPVRNKFLLEVAKSIVSLSSEHQVSVDGILSTQAYLDEVTRRILPTMKRAQQFYEETVKLATADYNFQQAMSTNIGQMFSVDRDISLEQFSRVEKAAGKVSGSTEKISLQDIQFLQNTELLPTKEEAKALERSTLEYLTMQLNWIYGLGSS